MLFFKDNDQVNQLISIKLLALTALTLSCFISCGLGRSAWAQTSARYANKRLAILELQGEVGTISEKQIWTDLIRSVAINLLKDDGILVIDRDQFKVLLDPQKSLSDCTDLCAAEMARELGAHWSLSGTLSKFRFEKGAGIMVTFKLHDVSGTLLAVKQSHFSKSKKVSSHLDKMTRSLIKQHLLRQDLDPAPFADQSPQRDQHELESNEVIQASEFKGLEEASVVKTDTGLWCVSPLVKTSEYDVCVQQGGCTARPTWGNCRTRADQPVTCVNLQQALNYSQWKASSLPSLSVLKALFYQAQLKQKVFEWISPVSLESPKEVKAWQRKLLKLDSKELKTYAKQSIVQGRVRGNQTQITPKKYPPAFQVSQLSFRLLTKDLSKCKPL